MNSINEEEAESIIPPREGSMWEHTKGGLYKVKLLTNMTATDVRYPKTVVYENTDTGELWSKPLSGWHTSMTYIEG
jgi:hypothetical protein